MVNGEKTTEMTAAAGTAAGGEGCFFLQPSLSRTVATFILYIDGHVIINQCCRFFYTNEPSWVSKAVLSTLYMKWAVAKNVEMNRGVLELTGPNMELIILEGTAKK